MKSSTKIGIGIGILALFGGVYYLSTPKSGNSLSVTVLPKSGE